MIGAKKGEAVLRESYEVLGRGTGAGAGVPKVKWWSCAFVALRRARRSRSGGGGRVYRDSRVLAEPSPRLGIVENQNSSWRHRGILYSTHRPFCEWVYRYPPGPSAPSQRGQPLSCTDKCPINRASSGATPADDSFEDLK